MMTDVGVLRTVIDGALDSLQDDFINRIAQVRRQLHQQVSQAVANGCTQPTDPGQQGHLKQPAPSSVEGSSVADSDSCSHMSSKSSCDHMDAPPKARSPRVGSPNALASIPIVISAGFPSSPALAPTLGQTVVKGVRHCPGGLPQNDATQPAADVPGSDAGATQAAARATAARGALFAAVHLGSHYSPPSEWCWLQRDGAQGTWTKLGTVGLPTALRADRRGLFRTEVAVAAAGDCLYLAGDHGVQAYSCQSAAWSTLTAASPGGTLSSGAHLHTAEGALLLMYRVASIGVGLSWGFAAFNGAAWASYNFVFRWKIGFRGSPGANRWFWEEAKDLALSQPPASREGPPSPPAEGPCVTLWNSTP